MKFVLFFVKSPYMEAIYSELYTNDQVIWYKELDNYILNSVRNIHTSMKLNKHFKVPLQGIWKHTFFDENRVEVDEECIFLFEEGNKQAYNLEYLTYLKKRYKKAKICFLYWNPAAYIEKKYIDFVNDNYKYIISFDIGDCKKYNWIHYSGIYSYPKENKKSEPPKYDILFVGHNKGRLEKIRTLYDKLRMAGLECDFYISEVKKEECRDDGIHYNEYLPYFDVIKHVQNSKAILEVLQDSQQGSTLRPMEALVYGKLLITNNKVVQYERYYVEEQFYIYEDIANINVRMIQKKCDKLENFSYDGILSPTLFLDFLESIK